MPSSDIKKFRGKGGFEVSYAGHGRNVRGDARLTRQGHHHHHQAKKEDLQNLIWFDAAGNAYPNAAFGAVQNAQQTLAMAQGMSMGAPMASVGAINAQALQAMGVNPAAAAQIMTAATTKPPKMPKGMKPPKMSKAQKAMMTAQVTQQLIQQGVPPAMAAQLAAQIVKNGQG